MTFGFGNPSGRWQSKASERDDSDLAIRSEHEGGSDLAIRGQSKASVTIRIWQSEASMKAVRIWQSEASGPIQSERDDSDLAIRSEHEGGSDLAIRGERGQSKVKRADGGNPKRAGPIRSERA
ncbi:hypothetical protein QUF72_20640 [Desulfobacterales bacterium HSG2]|nr:hypothetical protein [Desulfobacterales bacterium HSG2]